MPRCFVIQPFDKGPYDKRFRDVLAPAIREAALDPYRVDEDPESTIPIDDIEVGIRESDICLADITTDNPNVWYEVGFALANGKPVVLICSEPRPHPFPFDIRHRLIISYALDSASDFKKLEKDITARLKAQIKKASVLQTVASMSPIKATEGLSSYEIAILVTIMANRLSPTSTVTPNDIQRDMRRAGYTKIAVSISLESLLRKEMIEFEQEADYNGNPFDVCRISAKGIDWMLEDRGRFRMTQEEIKEEEGTTVTDEDIPF